MMDLYYSHKMKNMASPETPWSLATFAQGDQAVAALEGGGVAYRLAPSLARVGLAGQDSVLGLFGDWASSLAALNAAASQVQAADALPAGQRLAQLSLPRQLPCWRPDAGERGRWAR